MTSFELLICFLLMAMSAFLSSSEIALFSLSRFQLRSLKERFRPAHKKIKRLLADPAGLLTTILVMNEIVNISLSALVTRAVSRGWTDSIRPNAWVIKIDQLLHMPEWAFQTVFGIVVAAPVILFAGEVTPKVVAAKANHIVAPLNVGLLTWIYEALKPVRIILNHFVAAITHQKSRDEAKVSNQESKDPVLLEEEFLFMVEEGHKEGAIQQTELELIRNVFELDDRTVKDVYTPLSQVYSLPVVTTLKGALTAMRGHRYSRIPISGTNRKQIVGILYSKDLLLSNIAPSAVKSTIADTLAGTVSSMMRKPVTVSPDMRLNALFRKLKQQKTHMAIVEKAPGESIGVVTMSDVLEALFEDVIDEPEEHAKKEGNGK